MKEVKGKFDYRNELNSMTQYDIIGTQSFFEGKETRIYSLFDIVLVDLRKIARTIIGAGKQAFDQNMSNLQNEFIKVDNCKLRISKMDYTCNAVVCKNGNVKILEFESWIKIEDIASQYITDLVIQPKDNQQNTHERSSINPYDTSIIQRDSDKNPYDTAIIQGDSE